MFHLYEECGLYITSGIVSISLALCCWHWWCQPFFSFFLGRAGSRMFRRTHAFHFTCWHGRIIFSIDLLERPLKWPKAPSIMQLISIQSEIGEFNSNSIKSYEVLMPYCVQLVTSWASQLVPMTLSLADPMEADLFPLLGLGHPYRPYRKPYVFFWNISYIYTHVQIETRHEKTKAVWLSGKRAIAFATTMLSMLSLALLVLGVDAHPMAPTCHGFGGLGSSCVAATPGDSGKRRGSAFASTTLAVKAGETRDGRDRLIPLLLDLLQMMFFFQFSRWLIHQNWGIHWISYLCPLEPMDGGSDVPGWSGDVPLWRWTFRVALWSPAGCRASEWEWMKPTRWTARPKWASTCQMAGWRQPPKSLKCQHPCRIIRGSSSLSSDMTRNPSFSWVLLLCG